MGGCASPQQTSDTDDAEHARAALLDPSAWGGDHVGRGHPDFLEGSECLFCHRNTVGAAWQTNPHNRTIRLAEPDDPAMRALAADADTGRFVEAVEFLMGDNRSVRFLRRAEAYGKLELLTSVAARGAKSGKSPTLHRTGRPRWDTDTFAARCAGCHTTAVDSATGAFASLSLDCYVCHGNVPAEHANEPALMLFSRDRQDPARVVVSVCGQCHIRFGRSRRTGRPYPDTFVPGDNLFRDFQVDLSLADAPNLNPADRHVLLSVRDVVLYGKGDITCLSCHRIHKNSSKRHTRIRQTDGTCGLCHFPEGPMARTRSYTVRSDLCGY